ncbi:hypothetical protein OROMI_014581 [Orobanche minor]
MIHLYLPLISLLFLIITLKLFFIYTTRTFKNLPLGPQCLPIIGNLHQLKQSLHRTFHTLSQKHGKLFSIWFGFHLVVVSSLSIAQECFIKNDIILGNRPQFLCGKYVGYNNNTVSQSPYGDHWRNLRRILSIKILSSHRLNSFLEIRRDEIIRPIQKLAQMTFIIRVVILPEHFLASGAKSITFTQIALPYFLPPKSPALKHSKWGFTLFARLSFTVVYFAQLCLSNFYSSAIDLLLNQ